MDSAGLDLPQVQPLDRHNRTLVDNVHPPEWVSPEPQSRYNLVVIGAGTAGLVAAAVAAGMGAKVALVERELMGGDCLNVGCVPSKALIRCARSAAEVRRAGEFGVRVPGGVEVDFPAVMERMRRLRARISPNDSAAHFRELGVDVFLGHGRFVGPDRIQVSDHTLRFARACIATGARAFAPPIPGLAEAGYLTNETLFSLTELPRRLAVIGAGPIGCEMAQAFARFGSHVTLIEKTGRILARGDHDAAERVEQALVRDGVELVFGAKVLEVNKGAAGRTLLLETGGGRRELEVDELLIGIGRVPNVQDLGLDDAGVEYDTRGGVKVDDHLRTTSSRIFAAGDVCSAHKFTHTADAAAGIVIRNALFFGRSKVSALTIPWCIYTDPEIAHVGLHAHEAEERGIAVDTFTVELDDVDRAVLDGDDEGSLKIHVRRGTDRILGATMVASHAGEMISEITLAMVSGAGLKGIAGTIHPYPTQAEAIKRASNLYLKTRLTPRVKRLFTRILAWRR
ncbi:MAG: mercuric reductase [Planctomycetota bacterium]|nr:MAG: mercuric reductase [Planctomycetota bacterium]